MNAPAVVNIAVRRDDLTALDRAIMFFGSETKLATASGVSQAAINKAKKAGTVSPALAIRISDATGGKVGIQDLCPSIYEAVAREMASAGRSTSPTAA